MFESEKLRKFKNTIINMEKLFLENEADRMLESLIDLPERTQILTKETLVDNLARDNKRSLKREIEYNEFVKKQQKKDNKRKTISWSDKGKSGIFRHTKDCEVVVIDSIETAIKELSQIKEQSRDVFFFRGHEDKNYSSIPSILRSQKLLIHENDLYNELQTLSPKNFLNKNKHLEILTEMQHYSLPTRLLDITTNPLAALFFATSNFHSDSLDGELLVFNVPNNKVKTFSSDIVEIQSSLAYLPIDVKKEILHEASKLSEKKLTKEERINSFNQFDCVKKLMHEASKSGVRYTNCLDPVDLFSMFVCLPLKNNDRISSQSGAFFVYGFTKRIYDFNKPPQSISNEKRFYERNIEKFYYSDKSRKTSNIRKRFIIPFAYKSDIRDQLNFLGINQGNVYPDIEKRSFHIKEKYSKM